MGRRPPGPLTSATYDAQWSWCSSSKITTSRRQQWCTKQSSVWYLSWWRVERNVLWLFAGRYRYAASMSVSAAKPDAQSCSQLLQSVGLESWQIGHSKVLNVSFLRSVCCTLRWLIVIGTSQFAGSSIEVSSVTGYWIQLRFSFCVTCSNVQMLDWRMLAVCYFRWAGD